MAIRTVAKTLVAKTLVAMTATSTRMCYIEIPDFRRFDRGSNPQRG
jgi:hypothetical protein